MRKNKTKFIIFELVAIIFLATSGIFIRRSTLSPGNIGLWRILLSLPFLFFLARKNIKNISKQDIILSFVSGLFLAGDFIFFNMSIRSTSLANTNLLTNMTAFIIVPVSYFLFKEKIPKFYLLGLAISIMGVITLVIGKNNPSKSNYIGDLFAICACIFYSLYILTSYKLRDRVNSSVILFYGAFGTIFGLILVLALKEGFQMPTNRDEFINLLLFALCMQVIGQNLLTYCQGEVSVNLSIAITLLQPVFAAIYSFILFNEKLSFIEIIGIIIVIIGVYICKRQYN